MQESLPPHPHPHPPPSLPFPHRQLRISSQIMQLQELLFPPKKPGLLQPPSHPLSHPHPQFVAVKSLILFPPEF